jgi:hypothetical protein
MAAVLKFCTNVCTSFVLFVTIVSCARVLYNSEDANSVHNTLRARELLPHVAVLISHFSKVGNFFVHISKLGTFDSLSAITKLSRFYFFGLQDSDRL